MIIIQRVVPHYRLPLFERLWVEFGWNVIAASKPPDGTYLELAKGEFEFIKRYEFRFPNPRKPFLCSIPLGRILRETGTRAVIAEFSLHMSSTYELIARRRLVDGPATFFWSHGYNMERGLRHPLVQLPRAILSSLAEGHICYSEEGRDYLSRFMSRERIFVAKNTIDVAPLQSLARRVNPVNVPGRPHLITIGRLTIDKSVPALVRVFHRLRERFSEATLTIIGDGPDADRTRIAAGEQLDKSIRLVGALYDEEKLASHFLSADAVVFMGAVGLSVNHALAYSIPVIAYDRSPRGPHHHPEICNVMNNVTGLRVSPFTEDAMLQALQAFLNRHSNPRREFHESISRYVEDNLTLDSMVEGFRKVKGYIETLGIRDGQ